MKKIILEFLSKEISMFNKSLAVLFIVYFNLSSQAITASTEQIIRAENQDLSINLNISIQSSTDVNSHKLMGVITKFLSDNTIAVTLNNESLELYPQLGWTQDSTKCIEKGNCREILVDLKNPLIHLTSLQDMTNPIVDGRGR